MIPAPYAWLQYWMAYTAAYKADDEYTAALAKYSGQRYNYGHLHPELQRTQRNYHAAAQRMHDTLQVARKSGPRWPEPR